MELPTVKGVHVQHGFPHHKLGQRIAQLNLELHDLVFVVYEARLLLQQHVGKHP